MTRSEKKRNQVWAHAQRYLTDEQLTDEYTRRHGKNGLSPRGLKIKQAIDDAYGVQKVNRGRSRI